MTAQRFQESDNTAGDARYLQLDASGRAPSRVVSQSSSTVTVNNTTAETDLINFSFPAVVAGDVYNLSYWGDCLTNTGGSVTIENKLYLGATTIGDTGALTFSSSTANRRQFYGVMTIMCPTTSSQVWGGAMVGASGNAVAQVWVVVNNNNTGAITASSSEVLTSAKTLRLTSIFGSASTNLETRLKGYVLTRL